MLLRKTPEIFIPVILTLRFWAVVLDDDFIGKFSGSYFLVSDLPFSLPPSLPFVLPSLPSFSPFLPSLIILQCFNPPSPI